MCNPGHEREEAKQADAASACTAGGSVASKGAVADAASRSWEGVWRSHAMQRKKDQLRRRAMMVLTHLAVPLEREFNEVFIDIAWNCWAELIADKRRSREMPQTQGYFEALRGAFEHQGVDWLSDKQLQRLVEMSNPVLQSADVERLVCEVPREASGYVSVSSFLQWLYHQEQCSRNSGEPEPEGERCEQPEALWRREWEAHEKQRRNQQLRRRVIMSLALISVPEALAWNEIYIDMAWSAWAELAADARRRCHLPEAQRRFEAQVEAEAAAEVVETSPSEAVAVSSATTDDERPVR